MIFNFTNFSFVQKVKFNVQSPAKINGTISICLMDADAKRPGGGVGSMRTMGGGVKIGKSLWTSFMY